MPIPTASDVTSSGFYVCPPPPFPLSQVVDAYNNASNQDQEAFAELIFSNLSCGDINTGLQNGDSACLTDTLSILGVTPGGGGAGGGGGSPPFVLTAQEIADAIDVSPDPVINIILAQLGIPEAPPGDAPSTALNLYVNSQTNTQIENIPPVTLQTLIPGGVNLGARFVFGPGTNELDLVVNPVTKELDITGVIYLGDPPVAFEPTTIEPTQTQRCLGGQLQETSISVPVGNVSGNAYFTFSMVQQVFEKLDQLLRCCEPCSTPWVDVGPRSGSSIIEPPYDKYLKRVRLDEISLQVPIDLMPGIFDWKRYGRLAWIDRLGLIYDDVYIRYPGQIFLAPSADCVSVNLILNPGVHLELWAEYGPEVG